MSYFAVTREAGPGWSDRGGIPEQSRATEHAAFMTGLAVERFVLLAGPLAGSERGRIRVLLIVDALDEETIQGRLADDPWTLSGHLKITSIEPWTLFIGAERLVDPPASDAAVQAA